MSKVQALCESASDSTNMVADCSGSGGAGGNSSNCASGTILIHHSRNTDQKQWAETQVIFVFCNLT